MKQSYISPCETCVRSCNYTQCRDYRLWLNRCWGRYQRWQDRLAKPAPKPNVWRYDSPTLTRDYLENGPCVRCPLRAFCGENSTCRAYETWTKDRARRLAVRLAHVK